MKNSVIIIAFLISTISFSQSEFQPIYSQPFVTQLSNKKILSKKDSNTLTVIPIKVTEGMDKIYFSFVFLPPTVGMGKVKPLCQRLTEIQNWGHDLEGSIDAFGMPVANEVKVTVLSEKKSEMKNDITKTPLLKYEKTVSFADYVEVEPGDTIYFKVENVEKWKDTKVIFEAVASAE